MSPRRRAHRPLSLASSHWRADGAPKARFGSQVEAAAAAADRSRESGTDLGTYRCDYCDGWHMGRTSPGDDR